MLPSGKKGSTSTRPTAIWWVLGALFILALGQAYLLTPGGRQIPYSEFKQLVRNGQVAEVTVGETTIQGQLKKGEGDSGSTAFTTTRIDDPEARRGARGARRQVLGRSGQPLAAGGPQLGGAAPVAGRRCGRSSSAALAAPKAA